MEDSLLEHRPSSRHNAPQVYVNDKLVDENDFMSSIYDHAIPSACAVPGMCQANFEDQLDIFTVRIFWYSMICSSHHWHPLISRKSHYLSINDLFLFLQNCRHPLFSFFREHHTVDMDNGGTPVIEVEMLPAGAYVLPKDCEYCHAKSTAECSPFCVRPKLYFQKKRPPFTKPDDEKWDSQNDHAKVQILICSTTSEDPASLAVSNCSSKSSSDSSSTVTPTADVSAISYDSPPPAKRTSSWLWWQQRLLCLWHLSNLWRSSRGHDGKC